MWKVPTVLAVVAMVMTGCHCTRHADMSPHDLYLCLSIPQYEWEDTNITVKVVNEQYFANIEQLLGLPRARTDRSLFYLNAPQPGQECPPSQPIIRLDIAEDGKVTNKCYLGTYDYGLIRYSVVLTNFVGNPCGIGTRIVQSAPVYEDADGNPVQHGAVTGTNNCGKRFTVNYRHGTLSGLQDIWKGDLHLVAEVEDWWFEGRATWRDKDGNVIAEGVYRHGKPWQGTFLEACNGYFLTVLGGPDFAQPLQVRTFTNGIEVIVGGTP